MIPSETIPGSFGGRVFSASLHTNDHHLAVLCLHSSSSLHTLFLFILSVDCEKYEDLEVGRVAVKKLD